MPHLKSTKRSRFAAFHDSSDEEETNHHLVTRAQSPRRKLATPNHVPPPDTSIPDKRTVIVGNLDEHICVPDVVSFFGGPQWVVQARIKKGLYRSVANVEMRFSSDLPRVLSQNGTTLNGRILNVKRKCPDNDEHIRQTDEPTAEFDDTNEKRVKVMRWLNFY